MRALYTPLLTPYSPSPTPITPPPPPPSQPKTTKRYLHNRNFVHGDLRSPNLFVGADGKIKIGDFGFCRILRPDAEQVKVTQGTHPRWVAPEVMRSNELRKASDVYSYGMVGAGPWGRGRFGLFGLEWRRARPCCSSSPLLAPWCAGNTASPPLPPIDKTRHQHATHTPT